MHALTIWIHEIYAALRNRIKYTHEQKSSKQEGDVGADLARMDLDPCGADEPDDHRRGVPSCPSAATRATTVAPPPVLCVRRWRRRPLALDDDKSYPVHAAPLPLQC